METAKYKYKNPIEAVQITQDNIQEVATWCNGVVSDDIQLNFYGAEGFNCCASLSWWIVKLPDKSFTCYNNTDFKFTFSKLPLRPRNAL